jgi:tetratricopeptide (TPR) repeat protein
MSPKARRAKESVSKTSIVEAQRAEIERGRSVAEVRTWSEFEASLRQMILAYKQAQFDSSLRDTAQNLHSFLRTQERQDTSEFWKAVTLIYELNDIFHFDVAINDTALDLGKSIYSELRALSVKWETNVVISEVERCLAREKVMFCACRGNELKRRGQIEAARNLFEWLLNFTETKLKADGFPCSGTQARLKYHLGAVYRILERHNQAEDMYKETLDLLFHRVATRNEPEERCFMIRRQAMAIGIGFGWVNATRGSLRRAENALTTARSLLAGINDPVVPSYIELLYGTIKRCRAGTNRADLQEAVRSLKKAKTSFEEHGHKRYVPRACFELSLALSLLGEYEEAEAYLDIVDGYAEEIGHPKWQTNVRIVRSRLLRKQGDNKGALTEAERAIGKAEDCNSALPLTDAYITRGEARFHIAIAREDPNISFESARRDFEKALELIGKSAAAETKGSLPSNPKIVAVCELRIAQCFGREGDESKGRFHLSKWDILGPSVEHEWVRELAERVRREIDGLQLNFTISANDSVEWNYARNVARLRSWLMTQALRHTKKNYSAAAELIGVKRGTLYQWQDDSSPQSQRARTKPQ